MENNQTAILIIEDDLNYSNVLKELISSSDKYSVVAVYDNCEEAILNIKKDNPAIILMDYDLVGMNGIQGTIKIKQLNPSIEIILLTIHSDYDRVYQALCSGATGYLTKNSDSISILHALDEAIEGGAPMSSEIARMVVRSFAKNKNTPLTEKEVVVLTALSEGKSYKTIANTMAISPNTVKFHIKNIYHTLQVNNKEDAIQMAKSNKWI